MGHTYSDHLWTEDIEGCHHRFMLDEHKDDCGDREEDQYRSYGDSCVNLHHQLFSYSMNVGMQKFSSH